jgi:tetratricopeptide (TPR) repeat protein
MASARKAVELDPDSYGAHGALAYVLLFERHWDESAREFENSLRLNPNGAEVWTDFASLRAYEGRGVEAIACVETALRLDPHPPGWYFWILGHAQYTAGQYEAAVKTLSNEATYRSESRRILAAALAQLGRLKEARVEARLYLAGNPDFRISHWAGKQPFRDMASRDRLAEGMRKAGLPE